MCFRQAGVPGPVPAHRHHRGHERHRQHQRKRVSGRRVVLVDEGLDADPAAGRAGRAPAPRRVTWVSAADRGRRQEGRRHVRLHGRERGGDVQRDHHTQRAL